MNDIEKPELHHVPAVNKDKTEGKTMRPKYGCKSHGSRMVFVGKLCLLFVLSMIFLLCSINCCMSHGSAVQNMTLALWNHSSHITILILLWLLMHKQCGSNNIRKPPCLSRIATAFPKYKVTSERASAVADYIVEKYHQNKNPDVDRFRSWQRKVIRDSAISSRWTCLSSWDRFAAVRKGDYDHAEQDDLYNPYDWNPPREVRAAAYRYHSERLTKEACERALCNWGGLPREITHIVAITSSGWEEPGLASKMIEALHLSPNTEKYELCFNGCFAGVTGLRLANSLYRKEAATDHDKNTAILVVAVEVASVHYNATSFDLSKVLGNFLFGDGAAAVVVSSRGQWQLEDDFGNYQIPQSGESIQIHESTIPNHGGIESTISKSLVSNLKSAFVGPFGRMLVGKILAKYGLLAKKRPAFCLHPGGKRILGDVADACDKLHLGNVPKENFTTMEDYGNTATVSIFAVLERYLPRADRDDVVILGFGPGVTIEYGFLKRASS